MMGFVLVLSSTNRGSCLFINLTVIVFVDSFYVLLDLVRMTCTPVFQFLYFIIIVKFRRVCLCEIYILDLFDYYSSRLIYDDVSVIFWSVVSYN
jgi:hypothetical protein